MDENKYTTIHTDVETKAALVTLAEEDRRSTIDELRWLVQMELARREEVAEKELKK